MIEIHDNGRCRKVGEGFKETGGVDKVMDKVVGEKRGRIYSNWVGFGRMAGAGSPTTGCALKSVQSSANHCKVVQSTAKEDEAGSQI
jgi:hypothetical protein